MILNTVINILIVLVIVLLIVLIIGRINLLLQFRSQVKLLFASSTKQIPATYSMSQLIGLPAPVKLYFKKVLSEGQPYINKVSMTHTGLFKTGIDKGWVRIKGEQYATTKKPGFIWKGTTALFTARDMFLEDKGHLIVSLFAVFNVVNGSGMEYDQGELSRWLAESVLYPTNLLPSERLQWTAIDATHARIIFKYLSISLFFIVTFNAAGEITELETKRFMDDKNLETWIVKVADYSYRNLILVPTYFEVLWRLKDTDLCYAKFKMKKIKYS